MLKADLTIKEHSGEVLCLKQLCTDVLASSSRDNTIKLFDINNKNYKIVQIINYHTNFIYGINELKNKKLVSCYKDNSIIFYFRNDNHYIKDYQIKTNGSCWNIIQTKENEICYYENVITSI